MTLAVVVQPTRCSRKICRAHVGSSLARPMRQRRVVRSMHTTRARYLSVHANSSIKNIKPYVAVRGVSCSRGRERGGLVASTCAAESTVSATAICKDLPQHATHLQKRMITIRSTKTGSEATLICLDVTLKTARGIYTISSDGSLVDSDSSFGSGLFGAISWPVSRFRIADGLQLEQQMFLPHNGSTVAMSWTLHGDPPSSAQLVVRPFFAGCRPRSYRDAGFHLDSENNGGRLSWLPNVRGPRLFADTNGRYQDETVPFLDCLCEVAAASASDEVLIAPGRFEFELSRRPAVLILSADDRAATRHHQHIGVFLAGLMQENAPAPPNSTARGSIGVKIQQPAIA